MFRRRLELALDNRIKGSEMLRLYQETGNEIYKILADYYIGSSENLSGPSKLLNTTKKKCDNESVLYPAIKDEEITNYWS